jgi:hypothetical protein
MSLALLVPGQVQPTQRPVHDSSGPAWAGEAIGLVAAVLFVGFAAWIVVQRRRGRGRDDD